MGVGKDQDGYGMNMERIHGVQDSVERRGPVSERYPKTSTGVYRRLSGVNLIRGFNQSEQAVTSSQLLAYQTQLGKHGTAKSNLQDNLST